MKYSSKNHMMDIKYAMFRGDLEMLKHHKPENISIAWAVNMGHLHIVEWLYSSGVEISHKLLELAINRGDKKMVEWISSKLFLDK